ncbi:hypothetical protein [Celeribacter baekdonensis]|uniref:hypothetical protein n=1 Tax=Celeribacter baekdonensis TaxID=875171 RepID=UPI0002DADC7A|nr:hypothetical protein [Celeribacter baekdonensis]
MTLALLHATVWGNAQLKAYASTQYGVPLEVWDFSNDFYTSSWNVSRATSAVVSTETGILTEVSVNEARLYGSGPERGLLLETASSNISSAPSAPQTLSGVYKTGAASAVLSIVDDFAMQSAAGIASLTNGMAYHLDNTSGTSNARLALQQTFDSTQSAWVASAYLKATGQVTVRTGYGAYPAIGVLPTDPPLSASAYTRFLRSKVQKNGGAYNLNDVLWIDVPAGNQVWASLIQLEENQNDSSSIIPSTGIATQRAQETLELAVAPGNYNVLVNFTDGNSQILSNQASTGLLTIAPENKIIEKVRLFLCSLKMEIEP